VHRFPELAALPRAGLIHRLDKDTSGLLIVARTSAAYQTLNRAMAERRINRHYDAIVNGRIISGGSIDAPIGRDPVKRTRMSVRNGGRDALTHYRVAARYRAHTRLHVQLETGRTHQIRVHMAYIGHPLLGDTSYGARVMLPADPAAELERCVRGFARPALHARRLEFAHPDSGEDCVFHSEWPDDFSELVRACADDAARPAS
jgi:23S rRNA pseudouridine1911/1915/1917 synthase